MPILMDFSGTVHAAVHVDISNNKDTSEEFLRHLILNQIKNINKKFHKKYGELIICLDSKNGYWRRDIFPYYKAKRKAVRDASDIDWNTVFCYIDKIIDELVEYMPYKVLRVPKLEADDVIGTLAIEQPWNKDSMFDDEPCLIVSNDHDFRQLHCIPNVEQYFPASKVAKIIHEANPKHYLIEHILKGDAGDGVPNVRSNRNTFVTEGIRQKPVSAKYIKEYLSSGTVPSEDKNRFEENTKLIDLHYTPDELKKAAIELYTSTKSGNKSKMFLYFAKYGLNKHLENINDF